jgi:hypothetical protein
MSMVIKRKNPCYAFQKRFKLLLSLKVLHIFRLTIKVKNIDQHIFFIDFIQCDLQKAISIFKNKTAQSLSKAKTCFSNQKSNHYYQKELPLKLSQQDVIISGPQDYELP